MRRFIGLLVLVLLPVLVLAVLPATDTFTYSGSPEDLTTYSANWTYQNGGTFTIGLVANHVQPSQTSTSGLARWNADTFANDQYSAITIASLGSSSYVGPAVRISSSAATGYFVTFNSATVYVKKLVAGTETQLTTTALALSSGDIIRIEVSGTTLTVKRNGSVLSALTATDSAIASGSAGIEGFGSGAGTSDMSQWTGGNLTAASTAPTRYFVIGVGGE